MLETPMASIGVGGVDLGTVLDRQLRFHLDSSRQPMRVVPETRAAVEFLEPAGRQQRVNDFMRGWVELLPPAQRSTPQHVTVLTGDTPEDRTRGARATMLTDMTQRQPHLLGLVSGGTRKGERFLGELRAIAGEPLTGEDVDVANASFGIVRFGDAEAFTSAIDRGRATGVSTAEYTHMWRHELEHVVQPAFNARTGHLMEGAAENATQAPGELERTAGALGLQVTPDEAAAWRTALRQHPYRTAADYTAGLLGLAGGGSDPTSIARSAAEVFHAARPSTVTKRLVGRISQAQGLGPEDAPALAALVEQTPAERGALAALRRGVAELRADAVAQH
jgi:hypothetical protein